MNLTADQIDAIQELVNIGVGRAASVLNEMLEASIRLQVPYIKVKSPLELETEMENRLGLEQIAAVRQDFSGSFSGIAELVFPTDSASMLAAILTGEEPGTPDLDAVKISTLSEVGNILINSVIGSIGNLINQNLDYDLPIYIEDTVKNLLHASQSDHQNTILLAQTHFAIEQYQIRGDIILIFEVGSFDLLMNAIASEICV
ncbi:MAG: chemotaxis protein CheC [Oscillatoria sp. PMC 1051.18]|uniref:chemotaxis protein CheC n=1 Tax=Oscillatoria salina TaxID=331517 RepID=UPI0013B63901|nr:chemotaxis protein CheC [Oscillatoria salina]MBZ8180360.1 chemotaxis protein CheC [Oscillatoria salina IIICB1]MEC4892354.1 chemotaxis protein CheC [Oscillatoria sp. PMC 1050.18]MEC5029109.1 chemotaxis protein CheC [Oscillatoria sp. PMC 1051.18]NET87958.1 chemotaxis protein CheC [Kamptonema sp. SIO1D9]